MDNIFFFVKVQQNVTAVVLVWPGVNTPRGLADRVVHNTVAILESFATCTTLCMFASGSSNLQFTFVIVFTCIMAQTVYACDVIFH